jgi:hypothetical protein
MSNNRFHIRLWRIAFGMFNYPEIMIDKQMDEYSQEMPGIKHRLKDHDPLRVGDYEDRQPELDKWRIVYRIYHISVDCWWTLLSKKEKQACIEKVKRGYYPSKIDEYFWKIIERILKAPLSIYEILPWECYPLPSNWVGYIKSSQRKREGWRVNSSIVTFSKRP